MFYFKELSLSGTTLATALVAPFNARFSANKIFLAEKFYWS